MAEIRPGRTGNEILKSSRAKMKAAGLDGTVYSHPIGMNGHGAGPLIGLWDYQDGVPGRGDAKVIPNMWFSIELQATTKVPEWSNQPGAFSAGRGRGGRAGRRDALGVGAADGVSSRQTEVGNTVRVLPQGRRGRGDTQRKRYVSFLRESLRPLRLCGKAGQNLTRTPVMIVRPGMIVALSGSPVW